MEVKCLEMSSKHTLEYVVIATRYQNKWLMVRHQARQTWEMPGGHIEKGESSEEAAKRELYEETGALNFNIDPICDFYVKRENMMSYGRLYISSVQNLGPLPDSEIVEVKHLSDEMKWTYADIQPILFQKVNDNIKKGG